MKRSFILLLMVLFAGVMTAQTTSGAMGGLVTDNNNEALIGATVVVVHAPTGAEYGTVTQESGRYTINNMKVGGPYVISVSYLGYEKIERNEVYIQLGQKSRQDFELSESGVTVDEIVVTARGDDILNNERTGAETNIDNEMIAKLPTINRSSSDLTRLNAMAAEGGSFAGRNDQFNNYSLDGSIFNNPFGLDAATPGGQTDAQPVSLDAIEQINVSIAPYDVTQSGFTGASINAVTKSGTNEVHGSVFSYYTNKNFVGGKLAGEDIFKGEPSQYQGGFSVGGPIVKNKVFFFVNVEREVRSDLGSYWQARTDANKDDINTSRVDLADMQLISDILMDEYGYETGAFENYVHQSNNTKGLFKLDFNLSKAHKLTATYNFLDAFKDKPAHPSAIGRRGPDFTTLQFENSGYRINNKLHSGIVELRSFLGNNMSNNLQFGYTVFDDSRNPFSDPFPVLNIGKNGSRYIVAGHEPFSVNNVLGQSVLQFKNDFNYYKGKHNFLIGTSFEQFQFENSFNLTSYGFRVFGPNVDINDAEDVLKSQEFADEVAAARATFDNDTWALAETKVGQWSLYLQDEIQASDKLTLTAGIRMDMPLYFNTADLIQENIDRKGGHWTDGGVYMPEVEYSDEDGNAVTFDHTVLPKQTPLFNPRLGFNYDMNGDRSAQLRGGSGLFSGRFPFVWVGNQVANPDFFFYCMTDPDFKYPQIWRTNLGYDQKIADWTFSADLVYTQDINAQMVRNYGLKTPTGTLSGVDERPIYIDSTDRVKNLFGGTTNAYVFTNTAAGNSLNISLKAERSWSNNYVMLAYNYLDAKDAASIDAEISSDAYERNPANVMNTNEAELAPSLYGNRHRVVGAASKRFDYGNMATTISLFGELVEGGRYSYTYAGDINNDGSPLNDLIYVPTTDDVNNMNFAGDAAAQAAQKTGLEAFIEQDDYLSSRRGEYTEKYGALAPWYSLVDLRILQDFKIGENKVSLSVDVLNLGNLINSNLGVRQYATTSQLYQPLAVSVSDSAPTYSFDTDQDATFFNDSSLTSRWRMQFGLRFTF